MDGTPTLTPIGVFAYNRPRHLRLTLEALGRSTGFSEFPLFVFCDAPRRPQDATHVASVRALAREWTSAHGGEVIERRENLGYGNITQGITELCQRFGRTIVVEDDIIVAPDFIGGMRAGLDRYESEPRVYQVTGQMYCDALPADPPWSLLPICLIWGWATWDRAWQHFDAGGTGARELLGDTQRRRSFDVDGTFPFSQMLANVLSGKLKTWDILWSLSVFQQQGLGLCPWRPLTWNAGLGGGFHGLGGRDNLDHKIDFINGTLTRADFLRPRLDGRLDFPDRIEADEVAYARLAEFFRRTLTPARRVRRAFARGLDLLSSRWRREL